MATNNLTTNNTSLQELLATINELPDEKKLQATKTVTPTTSIQTVSPDSGYDGLSSVTVNAMPTATQATPSISVSTAGKITATSTQTAGYVASGTKTDTKQLTTKAATTITPTKSSQTAVAKNVYTTGVITVAAIPSQYEDITTPLADLNTANGGTAAMTMADAVDNTEILVSDEAMLLEQAIAALEGKAGGSSGSTSTTTYPNGTVWTQSNITTMSINDSDDILMMNGVWVAYPLSNGIYYSNDGKTWNSSNVVSGNFETIYSSDIILMIKGISSGGSGVVYYSTDGITWTQSNISNLKNVYYNGGVWVGCSDTNVVYYSTNGKTWSQSNLSGGIVHEITYDRGIWVLSYGVNNTKYIYYSKDGITWTKSAHEGYLAEDYNDAILYNNNNGMWVFYCTRGTTLGAKYSYSTDGISWTSVSLCVGGTGYISTIYYADGLWVLSWTSGSRESVLDDGNSIAKVSYSTDCINWTDSNYTYQSRFLGGFFRYKGVWFSDGFRWYSNNGKTWSNTNNPILVNVNDVYSANGISVTAKTDSGIYYSTDGGITWTPTNVTIGSFSSICNANGLWVTSNQNGIYYSTDGKTWTNKYSQATNLKSIKNSNGIWVGGNSSGLWYSVGWEPQA